MHRRTVLNMGLGLGAGLALGPWRALAQGAGGVLPEVVSKAIPSTGELLPVIGIGTARRFDVGDSAAQRAPLLDVLGTFPRLGGRLIDTAPSYGNAEAVIGELVEQLGLREALFLATKVRAGQTSRAAGIAEMEASIRQLRVDHIDLMQVHNLAGADAMLPVLREWRARGRVRHIGVTTSFKNQYPDVERILASESIDVVQVDYAIDNREAEERILPLAADRGVAVLVNLPFGRGRVFQAFGDRPLPEWARELGIASWAQFALKFVVSHPAVTATIPGTATVRYLNDNMAAARGPMPDAATRRRMAELIDAG